MARFCKILKCLVSGQTQQLLTLNCGGYYVLTILKRGIAPYDPPWRFADSPSRQELHRHYVGDNMAVMTGSELSMAEVALIIMHDSCFDKQCKSNAALRDSRANF